MMTGRQRILMIGLRSTVVDYTKWPELTPEKLESAFTEVFNQLEHAGYEPAWCLTDTGETAERQVTAALDSHKPDTVLIGAGVRTDRDLFLLFERIINVVRTRTPEAAIVFNTNPFDSVEAVRRADEYRPASECHPVVGSDVPVSGYQKTERLVYFARMCSKARLMQQGLLPEAYHPYIGIGFDGRCCRFLNVSYEDVKRLIAEGRRDEEILEWCYAHGRRPNDEEVFIWNLFMEKRGWRDDDSALLQNEKESIGLGDRDEIQTLFDFYDFDEGRRS